MLTNLQLYLAIGIPSFTILSSMVLAMFQMSGVRDDIREIRSDIKILTGKVADVDNRLILMECR